MIRLRNDSYALVLDIGIHDVVEIDNDSWSTLFYVCMGRRAVVGYVFLKFEIRRL
jgi:hypothetical protein